MKGQKLSATGAAQKQFASVRPSTGMSFLLHVSAGMKKMQACRAVVPLRGTKAGEGELNSDFIS